MLATTIITTLCLTPTSTPEAVPERPAERKLRTTMQKSIGFLRREGQAWIEDRKCVSCHQIPAMLWSLNEIDRLSLSKEDLKLKQLSEWSVTWKNWPSQTDKDPQKKIEAKNVDTIAHLMLGRGPEAREASWAKEFAEVLLREQKENGSWKFGGQLGLQHRPPAESGQVTTMWALLALSSVRTVEAKQASAKAMAWLNKQKPGISTEWLVTRALVEHRFGDREQAKTYLKKLISEQNKDGGWGWLRTKPSNAFGTGLVLYALAKAGMKEEASIHHGLSFLQKTQRKDGSWPVPTTLKRRKDRLEPTSVYWGTAWAVIGIAQTLEPQ